MFHLVDELKKISKLGPFGEATASPEEMETYFVQRTLQHMRLVSEAIKKIVEAHPDLEELLSRTKTHDASKFEEPERTPYISISWRHKVENAKGEFDPIKGKGYQTPGMLAKEDENKATLHHITTNSHHPEYHNKEQANINKADRDKSERVLDATKMPPLDVAEMVADWQAMAEELKKNTAREWYNRTKNVRWKFSEEQDKLIDKLLKVFETQSHHSLDPHDGDEDDGW